MIVSDLIAAKKAAPTASGPLTASGVLIAVNSAVC
jgi:hypothetical protein